MDVFPFAFEPGYVRWLRLAGLHPGNCRVVVGDDCLLVEFGRWRLDTPLANIECLRVTGDYRWYRALGLRGSFADGGVTFGTNTHRGLCVLFRDPVPPVSPLLRRRHPGMTVTVDDIDGLRHRLQPSGGPG